MIKVKNKLDVDLSSEGAKLQAIYKELGLNYSLDKVGGKFNSYQADDLTLLEKLEKATTFKFYTTLDYEEVEQYLGEAKQERLYTEKTGERFFKVYELAKLGFWKLKVGEEVSLHKTNNMVKNLCNAPFAHNLQIWDNDVLIWDGGKVEVIETIYKSRKDFDDEKLREIKVVKICNLLHPEKLAEPYYPPTEVEQETIKTKATIKSQ